MRCLALVVLAGCVTYTDSVHMRLKDPAQVTIAGVLAAGAARGDIPETLYVNQPVAGSWIDRSDGALDLWCPECAGAKRTTIALAPELVLPGSSADVIHLEGDRLRVHYVYTDASGPLHHGRHGRWHEVQPRIALDLETPIRNVDSIEIAHLVDRTQDPEFEHRMDVGAAVWGGVWIAAGLALGGLGLHDHEGGLVGAGVGMAVIGTALLALQVRVLRAHDEHRVVRF